MKTVLKFGLVTLALGLLSFIILYAVYGGVGPCALPGQIETLFLGIACTGIGGVTSLVSLPVVLIKNYKTHMTSDLSLFDPAHRDP